MKELTLKELDQRALIGGLTGRQCMLLGGLAFGAALGQQWGAAIGVTAASIVGGCFD